MVKIKTDPVDDRIHFYCTGHATQLPIVTMHERRWAYCPGGYFASQEGHAWVAIEPTSVYQIKPQAFRSPTVRLTRTA
jgi:hypothetical protein